MSHFFAYMSRLKLIRRWSLMRNLQEENTQEHSLQVAMVAHALALIRNRYYGGNLDAEHIAVAAMYHDAGEVLTGDLPTPIKYANPEIRDAYHRLEDQAGERLLAMLPEELQQDYRFILQPQDALEQRLIHAADKICAYWKCVEETAGGNGEFAVAKETIEQSLEQFQDLPEVKFFLQHFGASFGLTLDELK